VHQRGVWFGLVAVVFVLFACVIFGLGMGCCGGGILFVGNEWVMVVDGLGEGNGYD
jgi:hypothetical protein